MLVRVGVGNNGLCPIKTDLYSVGISDSATRTPVALVGMQSEV
jgi:hypothetical protein